MLKAIAKRLIAEDCWLFMSWYRAHFGILRAALKYIALRNLGIGSAPNPLTGDLVYLRPGTADQDVYEQVFMANEYKADLGDPHFIVDAGAHIGLASIFFADRYPKATIIAIEPEPSNFAVLQRNVANYSNIKPVNAGLWSKNTRLSIEDANATTWCFRVFENPSKGEIQAVGIQELMAAFNMKRIDVLKIDIEGSEVEVMNHSQPWIDAVKMLIIELHDDIQPGGSEALQNALTNHTYRQSVSGENLIITDIKRTPGK